MAKFDVLDMNGKKVSTIELSDAVFGITPNEKVMHTVSYTHLDVYKRQGMTKALAQEEGPSGITVNCVAPGVVETDMMRGFSLEDKQVLAQETPCLLYTSTHMEKEEDKNDCDCD